MHIKYTLIVASLNSELALVKKLVKSIEAQTADFDILFITSGDTLDVLDLLQKAKKPIQIRHMPKKGIYAAYNEGIRYVDEGFISFMGTDDYFHNSNSVRDILVKIKDSGSSIGLTNSYIKLRSGKQKKFPKIFNLEKILFKYSPIFHHQGFLCSVNILKDHLFDTSESIFSDQYQLHNILGRHKLNYFDIDFSVSKVGGISSSETNKPNHKIFTSTLADVIYKVLWIFR